MRYETYDYSDGYELYYKVSGRKTQGENHEKITGVLKNSIENNFCRADRSLREHT